MCSCSRVFVLGHGRKVRTLDLWEGFCACVYGCCVCMFCGRERGIRRLALFVNVCVCVCVPARVCVCVYPRTCWVPDHIFRTLGLFMCICVCGVVSVYLEPLPFLCV